MCCHATTDVRGTFRGDMKCGENVYHGDFLLAGCSAGWSMVMLGRTGGCTRGTGGTALIRMDRTSGRPESESESRSESESELEEVEDSVSDRSDESEPVLGGGRFARDSYTPRPKF